jgi:hypothetical protein
MAALRPVPNAAPAALSNANVRSKDVLSLRERHPTRCAALHPQRRAISLHLGHLLVPASPTPRRPFTRREAAAARGLPLKVSDADTTLSSSVLYCFIN